MKKRRIPLYILFLLLAGTPMAADPSYAGPSLKVGTFPQQVQSRFSEDAGLPTGEVYDIEISEDGKTAYVASDEGAYLFDTEKETATQISESQGTSVRALAIGKDGMLGVAGGALYRVSGSSPKMLTEGPRDSDGRNIQLVELEDRILLGTRSGLHEYTLDGDPIAEENGYDPIPFAGPLEKKERRITQIAVGPRGQVAVATYAGLYVLEEGKWSRLDPKTDEDHWLLVDVRGVDWSADGDLWFASKRGVGRRDAEGAWSLYTPEEGLPYDDLTCVAAHKDGEVWFGTNIGAIRFDGETWEYRQGKRWLPGDVVFDIETAADGSAWFATDAGIGRIEFKPMTLAEKAVHYEDLIDKYNRRTEYGYVLEARLNEPGNLDAGVTNHDSDNDGLWTAMYGAGECFAYAATKDPKAKKRAKDAFEALRFLSIAPVGGEVDIQPGYVARTVVATTEKDPNLGYTIEQQQRTRDNGDYLWKVYSPRWPLTADKKYWYKTDTSSDELDGHYFFYPLYYDLVAETEEEKERVREVVKGMTDHLVRNNFCLVDHDGTPTRWSDYSPENLNHNHDWYNERGLKSLSMLSYLLAAQHVTGDTSYGDHVKTLREKHAYDTNAMVAKIQTGVGSGNQSDDEMAIMCYYNLLKYTDDEELKKEMTYSFCKYWILEYPELNPFFNFCYAAHADGFQYTNPWGTWDLSPWEGWLEDSADSLKRFPLDRIDWGHKNDHRSDIEPLDYQAAFEPYETEQGKRTPRSGRRKNKKAVPVDERHFNHWNTNPWSLRQGGNGGGLSDGAVYLLPYYMGLYHGFIQE